MRWVLVAVWLIGLLPSACPASAQVAETAVSERVQIFYYPWYGTPATDGRWVHWQENGRAAPNDLASSFVPELGAYSSRDTATLDQHMTWIARSGAGVVVTSWWGRDTFEDQAVPALLTSAASHGLKVAFHIEPYVGRTAESVRSDIEYIYACYGSSPAFFRQSLSGRTAPGLGFGVFYVYDSLAIPTADWRAMLDGLHGTSNDPLVLSETSDLRQVDDGHFDGLYTYDVYGVDGAVFASIAAELARRGAIFAPSVGPGYDDTRATQGHHVKARQNGATYDAMWLRAMTSGSQWITITSFNEWHEGTQIEPAARTRGSDGYDGAFGSTGAAAELAYIDRTRLMVNAFALR